MTRAQAVLILPFLSLAGLVAAAPCSTSTTTTYPKYVVGSPGLGQLFYLPDKLLLQNSQQFTSGYPVFKSAPDCTLRKQGGGLRSAKESYSSTEDLLSSRAFGFSVSGGFPTQLLVLGDTAQSVTSFYSGFDNQYVSAKVYQEVSVIIVDYVNSDACRELEEGFLGNFEGLPDIDPNNAAKIMDTGPSGAWHAYITFLQKYGTHIMETQHRGGAFWEWASSGFEEDTGSRMEVKACYISRFVDKMSLAACAGYSDEELRAAQYAGGTSVKKALGGTDETLRAVLTRSSQETLDAFMNASIEHPNTYQHDFQAIWDQLKNQYQELCTASSSDTSKACKLLQKAYNLQAAFEGVMAWECNKATSAAGVLLQSLEVQDVDSNPVSYQCKAGYTGCSRNSACTGDGASGGGCICKGDECFVGTEIADGVYKTTVSKSNGGDTGKGVNRACYCAGFICASCHCNINTEWTSRPYDLPLGRMIWTQDT